MAASGNRVAISFCQDDGAAKKHGSVRVYAVNDAGEWSLEATVEPEDLSDGCLFGWSLSIAGELLVIGAPGVGNGAGACYVFEFDSEVSSWKQTARLAPTTLEEGDQFGFSVAASADRVLCGAWGGEAAYLYEKYSATSEWKQSALLTPTDADANSAFGWSVCLSDDHALVGDVSANDGAGAVYLYEAASGKWSEAGSLKAAGGATGDLFGYVLAAAGSNVAVGAPGADGPFKDTGSVHVFSWSETDRGWQETKITSDTPNVGDRFGQSIACGNEIIAVGCPATAPGGTKQRAARLITYSGTEWKSTGTVEIPFSTRSLVGCPVAIHDDDLLTLQEQETVADGETVTQAVISTGSGQ